MSDRAEHPLTGGAPPAGAGQGRTDALAGAVRGRREALGLLQTELAQLAGCSTRFVHTLEHGKPTVRLDKVLDVLHVLGLDLQITPGRGRLRARESPEVDG